MYLVYSQQAKAEAEHPSSSSDAMYKKPLRDSLLSHSGVALRLHERALLVDFSCSARTYRQRVRKSS